MVDQQPTNPRQANTGAHGEEVTGEQITINDVQLEMLKELKEAQEGQGMMIIMSEMQRQQEEMETFRQQLMHISTFKAMFPGSSQAERVGVDDDDNNKGMPPITEPSDSNHPSRAPEQW